MPTTSRFTRGFSNFHAVARLAMGLSLGLVASGLGAAESVAKADPANRVVLHRANLSFDGMAFGDHAIGSVCTTGPIRCHAHARVTLDGHVQAAAVPGLRPARPPVGLQHPDHHLGHADGRDLSMRTATRTSKPISRCIARPTACRRAPWRTAASRSSTRPARPTPLPANPPANDDWTLETALDVDMASAACPSCKILVVQADRQRRRRSLHRSERRRDARRDRHLEQLGVARSSRARRSRRARRTSTTRASRLRRPRATTATTTAARAPTIRRPRRT